MRNEFWLACNLFWIVAFVLAPLASLPRASAQIQPTESATANITVAELAEQLGWRDSQILQLEGAITAATAAHGTTRDQLISIVRKLNENLIVGGQIDPSEVIRELDTQAARLAALERRYALLERVDDPEIAQLLNRFRLSMAGGDLDAADHLLAQADAIDAAAIASLGELQEQTIEHQALRQRRSAQTNQSRAEIALLRADFLAAAGHFQQAAQVQPIEDVEERFWSLMRQAQALDNQASRYVEPDHLGKAISVLVEAGNLADESNDFDLLIAAHTGLAQAHVSLHSLTGEVDLLNQAIQSYDRALRLLANSSRLTALYSVKLSKANCLYEIGIAREHNSLREAEYLIREVIEFRSSVNDDRGLASAQVNLSLVLRTMGVSADPIYFNEAEDLIIESLEFFKLTTHPEEWATAKMNLATIALESSDRGDGSKLVGALVYLDDAETVFSRDYSPRDWAAIQHNRGLILTRLGSGGDVAALHQAVMAIMRSLEVRSFNNSPSLWAISQLALGDALQAMGLHADETLLVEAEKAYENALMILTHEQDPSSWGKANQSLGNLMYWYVLGGDEEKTDVGIDYYNNALSVLDINRQPVKFANIEFNKALLLRGAHRYEAAEWSAQFAADLYRLSGATDRLEGALSLVDAIGFEADAQR